MVALFFSPLTSVVGHLCAQGDRVRSGVLRQAVAPELRLGLRRLPRLCRVRRRHDGSALQPRSDRAVVGDLRDCVLPDGRVPEKRTSVLVI